MKDNTLNRILGLISVMTVVLFLIAFTIMLSLIHINGRMVTIEQIDSVYDSKYVDVDIHNQYPDDDIELIRYFKGDVSDKK